MRQQARTQRRVPSDLLTIAEAEERYPWATERFLRRSRADGSLRVFKRGRRRLRVGAADVEGLVVEEPAFGKGRGARESPEGSPGRGGSKVTIALASDPAPCQVCEFAADEHWWGTDRNGSQRHHCSECHRTWTGERQTHCTRCHRHFSSHGAFARHLWSEFLTVKTPRGYECHDEVVHCVDPAKVSRLQLRQDRYGDVWGFQGGRPPVGKASRSQDG